MSSDVAASVVLWDIDGTLLRAPGIGVKAFVSAVQRVTGAEWTPRRLDFGGRTDPEIASLILADAGFDDPALVAPVLETVVAVYDELADELHAAVRVLPGVDATLQRLGAENVLQTLVTGNLKGVAEAKVGAGRLEHHLRVELGGYGSDHAERAELVRLSLQRVSAAGIAVDRSKVWVIGDTPRDLACARANDVRCVLVATGTHPLDDLTALGADLALADLSRPGPLFEALGLP